MSANTMTTESVSSDNQSTTVFDDDNFISRPTLQIILTVTVFIIACFCVLGSLGNILSLVILFSQWMRTQTNLILAALCVSDTLFLVHSLFFTGLNVYMKKHPLEGEALRAAAYPYLGAYGSIVTARITSGLTTLLCVERFVAVFYPMQARYICTKKITGIAIMLIYVITILLFIPFIFKYEATENIVNGNLTRTYMNVTTFYENNSKFYEIYGYILNMIFRIAPLFFITILNMLMIRAVRKTWLQRKRSSENGKEPAMRISSRSNSHCSSHDQNHTTIMLLTVSFTFVICILPGALNSIASHIWKDYSKLGRARNLYVCISTLTFLLETINSSVNFIIYMALSRKFRLMYKEKFCCGHGQYYQKISITSVREKFRWSSAKKNNIKKESDTFDQNGRKTVSDLGPCRDDLELDMYGCYGNNWKHGRHSEGDGRDIVTVLKLIEKQLQNGKDSNCNNKGPRQNGMDNNCNNKRPRVYSPRCPCLRGKAVKEDHGSRFRETMPGSETIQTKTTGLQ